MTLRNPYTGSEVLEMSFSISADVYSDLSIGLALKHYPKMTPDTLNSVHWIRSYLSFFMSVDMYSDLTIGLALKIYPKMSPHVEIDPLDPKL